MLFDAVKDDNTAMVERLITAKVDVDTADNRGRTPLMHAVMLDYIEMAKMLVRYGADVNAKDIYGRSILQIAEESGGELVEFLKMHGAKH